MDSLNKHFSPTISPARPRVDENDKSLVDSALDSIEYNSAKKKS